MNWDDVVELKAKNYKSFDDNEFCGFDGIKTTNIIVGRNNSGKSSLLDLVDIMGKPRAIDGYAHEKKGSPKIRISYRVTPDKIDAIFNDHSGGAFPGNHREEAKKYT